jgi:hypothetical protein
MANSIDDFLNHRTNSGDRASFFKWKDKGEADVWLHTKCMPKPVWRHQIPKLVPIEDKDTKETHIMLWSENAVCHEDEEILRAQYQRDDDGARKKTPTKCGLCRYVEWVFQQVQQEKLSWTDPVLHFEGFTKEKIKGNWEYVETELTLHAGGLYGAFQKVEDDDEKRELKEAGIFLKEAWKEKMLASCNYIFRIVDNKSIKDGVQIAIEASLLGDKVKTVISDRMQSVGRDKGNPMVTPYAIRWKYNDKEKEFGKKYHALPLEEERISQTIRDLIIEAEPPDITRLTEPYNQATVRAFFEKHSVLKNVPWDKLFRKESSAGKSTTAGAEAEKASSKKAPDSEPDDPDETQVRKKQDDGPPKGYTTSTGIFIPEDDAVECNKCDKPMHESWNKCVECGKTYEGGEDPPEPPKKEEKEPKIVPRRRMKEKAETKPAPKSDPPPKKKPKDEEEDEGGGDEDDDSIPF